jgi:enterochelin esterase-like enzyme
MRHWLRALAIAVSCACATVAAAASPPAGHLEQLGEWQSTGLLPHRVSVWLPPGYESGSQRYGVLYMHDGQNLYDGAEAFGGVSWGVDQALLALIARGELRPVIVVGIANNADRFREYLPNGVVAALPAGMRQELQAAQGEPLADAYLGFIVRQLKPFVDSHYRTLPDVGHTAMAGSSMGGLISLYALGEYPQVFGAAAALSTHLPLLASAAVTLHDGGHRSETIQAFATWLRPRLAALRGHRLYLDHGTEGLDALYPPYERDFDALLPPSAAGDGLAWSSREFPGAGHNEAAWRARLAQPLAFILGPPPHVGSAPHR